MIHKEEYEKRTPTKSLTEKIKQGFQSLKDKLLGADEEEEFKEELPPKIMESDQILEDIPDERIVEKQNKPTGKAFVVAHQPEK